MKNKIAFLIMMIVGLACYAQRPYILPCKSYAEYREVHLNNQKIFLQIRDMRGQKFVESAKKNKFSQEELISTVRNTIIETYPNCVFIDTLTDDCKIAISVGVAEYHAFFQYGIGIWESSVRFIVQIKDSRGEVPINLSHEVSGKAETYNTLGYSSARKSLTLAYAEAAAKLIRSIDAIWLVE